MTAGVAFVARGRIDPSGRLIAADEPLATLQRTCGGEMPGIVAIPALLELARKAWRYRLKLARTIRAQDASHAISAWVELEPDHEGCAIAVSNWRAAALELASGEQPGEGDAQTALTALLAELHVRLDAAQSVLTVGRAEPRLAALGDAMREGRGRPWTDFVEIVGNDHRQPLDWRLLDGAAVGLRDAAGRWQARLVPQLAPGGRLGGLDLYLIPSGIDAVPDPDEVEAVPAEVGDGLDALVGRDLAPVLRRPVNRIVANAETIRTRLAGPLAEQYASYAADIADAAKHLLALVEDIADLEAIEAPGFAPLAETVDLAEAGRRAAGILTIKARERGIAIELPPPELHVAATGEYRRVLQVLLNLIGNAVRYAPANSTVRLELWTKGNRAALCVADEGEGLSAEKQAKVFAKFERLGRSGDGGSGLGLYISRGLARAMGGDLTVASAPGAGARFTLELPAPD